MRNQLSWGKPTVWFGDKQIDVNASTSMTLEDTELSDADNEASKYGAKHYSLTFELNTTSNIVRATSSMAVWFRKSVCPIHLLR